MGVHLYFCALHPAHHHRHLCATMDKLLLHGYCLGTAAWYTLRGGCRIWDPAMVVGWFRPPAQRHLEPNDLELYNVRTDAWGLLSLAGVMVTISQAVPYPRLFASSTSTDVKVGVKDDEEKQLIAPSVRTTSPPASGLSSTTSVTPTTTPRWASVSGRMPSSPSSGLPPSLQETEGSRRGERPGKVGLSGSKRELDEKRVCRSCAP